MSAVAELVAFDVEGIPVPQGSLRPGGQGQLYYSNAHPLYRWRALVADACPIAVPEAGPWRITMAFRIRRPASVKREYPTVMPDLDKYVRAVLDALTGLVWIDDGQVVQLQASKRYGLTPGCTIVVSREQDA